MEQAEMKGFREGEGLVGELSVCIVRLEADGLKKATSEYECVSLE